MSATPEQRNSECAGGHHWLEWPFAVFLGFVLVLTSLPQVSAQGPEDDEEFEVGSGVSSSGSVGGYIDSAAVRNMVRLRFDSAHGNESPDRAEFFYAKCGCFGGGAPGPPRLETEVDHQSIKADIEFLLTCRVSALIEIPVRFINPEQNENSAGLSDLQVGFKYAVIDCPCHTVTFQLRTYLPTGDADRGLGTDHLSVEPGLLWSSRKTERLKMEGEFKAWIPINGSSNANTGIADEDFAGTVLRYGIGCGIDLSVNECRRLTSVVEFVGWTILGGIGSSSLDGITPIVESVAGQTIVNAKFGLRRTNNYGGSLYAGYGIPLTDDDWYDDILRVEYRQLF